MIFEAFLAKWTNPAGQRIDYDHVYGYQCVDLIREYVYECDGLGTGVSGNAIDYWNNTSAALFTKFTKIQTQDVQAGDITVLTSPITPLGHIGIATGNLSGSNFEMMEQNGGSGSGNGTGTDAIRTRYIAKSRIVGVLRPIPAAPAVPMINLDQLTELYQDILQRAPDQGGVLHYVGHYTYDFVRNDMLNSQEYKNLQASQAAAAAATAQAAANAAAAAAQAAAQAPTVPIATGSSAPAGAMTVPTSTTKYPIKTTLKTYGSMTDATNRTSPKGEIMAGATWYQYCEKGTVINITQTPGVSTSTWINPADNVMPVVAPQPPVTRTDTSEPTPPADVAPAAPVETAADIVHSFIPLMPNGSPIECKVLQNVMAIDALGLGSPITATKEQYVKVYGTHEAGGHLFATVHSNDKAAQANQMYGILITSRDNFAPYLSDPYNLGERIQVNWELVYDKVYKTIDGVFRALKKKK